MKKHKQKARKSRSMDFSFRLASPVKLKEGDTDEVETDPTDEFEYDILKLYETFKWAKTKVDPDTVLNLNATSADCPTITDELTELKWTLKN